MPTKVFVYGTLKLGHYNNYLLENSAFLGRACTRGKMYSMGRFPAVVTDEPGQVVGEIFEVGKEALEDLDRLEGHPHWYKRELVDTSNGHAFMYTMNTLSAGDRARLEHVEGGEWLN